MDGLDEWTPTSGSPQGAVISPLLSNVYLDPLDHLMAEQGIEMVRYADDMVILCPTAEHARAALAERVLCRVWVVQHGNRPCRVSSARKAVNRQPESRLRQNRTHGSEGGKTGINRSSRPLSLRLPQRAKNDGKNEVQTLIATGT